MLSSRVLRLSSWAVSTRICFAIVGVISGISPVGLTASRKVTWAGSAPDLRFVPTSPSAMQISTSTQRLDVAIVAFRQEQAWMGLP